MSHNVFQNAKNHQEGRSSGSLGHWSLCARASTLADELNALEWTTKALIKDLLQKTRCNVESNITTRKNWQYDAPAKYEQENEMKYCLSRKRKVSWWGKIRCLMAKGPRYNGTHSTKKEGKKRLPWLHGYLSMYWIVLYIRTPVFYNNQQTHSSKYLTTNLWTFFFS